MSRFTVVVATERRVCTCLCGHHHIVMDGQRRCKLFIEVGERMVEDPTTNQYSRRCVPCAVAADIISPDLAGGAAPAASPCSLAWWGRA